MPKARLTAPQRKVLDYLVRSGHASRHLIQQSCYPSPFGMSQAGGQDRGLTLVLGSLESKGLIEWVSLPNAGPRTVGQWQPTQKGKEALL